MPNAEQHSPPFKPAQFVKRPSHLWCGVAEIMVVHARMKIARARKCIAGNELEFGPQRGGFYISLRQRESEQWAVEEYPRRYIEVPLNNGYLIHEVNDFKREGRSFRTGTKHALRGM
jgi:hypothetical protein